MDEAHNSVDHRLGIHQHAAGRLWTGVSQQVSYGGLQLVDQVTHLLQDLPAVVVVLQALIQEIYAAGDSNQRVLHLVCDARGQFADGRQLSCTPHLVVVELLDLPSGSLELLGHLVERLTQIP